jgi:hypothetical protein
MRVTGRGLVEGGILLISPNGILLVSLGQCLKFLNNVPVRLERSIKYKSMSAKQIIISILLLFTMFSSKGQMKTITGKVVDEFDLIGIPGVQIQSKDTVLLTKTDMKGNFKIDIPSSTDSLLLGFVGMEWTLIKVPENCENLEIIMMYDANYDFITINQLNRKRYRRFRNLSNKHQEAFRNGMFKNEKPCFEYVFKKY